MELAFYKNTLTREQVIELLRLYDNFTFKDENNIVIEFKERGEYRAIGDGDPHWYCDMGFLIIYNRETTSDSDLDYVKTRGINGRNEKNVIVWTTHLNSVSYYGTKNKYYFNEEQIKLYEKFINESYGVLKCPYFIINNKEDLEILENKHGYDFYQFHKFPFIVGKEGGRIFQLGNSINNISIPDYYSHDQRLVYKYELKQLDK